MKFRHVQGCECWPTPPNQQHLGLRICLNSPETRIGFDGSENFSVLFLVRNLFVPLGFWGGTYDQDLKNLALNCRCMGWYTWWMHLTERGLQKQGKACMPCFLMSTWMKYPFWFWATRLTSPKQHLRRSSVKPWGWAILQQASVELLFPPLKECSKTRLLNLPHAIFIRGKKNQLLYLHPEICTCSIFFSMTVVILRISLPYTSYPIG